MTPRDLYFISLRMYANAYEQFVQTKISELLKELEEWANIALIGSEQAQKGKQKADFRREYFLLQTDYWSTKMLITRPCLCRMERHFRNESETSASFNAKTAEVCVEAALELIKLFPDHPDLDFIYTKGPWWTIVHLSKLLSKCKRAIHANIIVEVMQAVAILLLEAAHESTETRPSDPSTIESIKKLIRWLRAMQNNDPVAARAYHVIWKILKECAPALQPHANHLAFPEELLPRYQDSRSPLGAFAAQQTTQVPPQRYYHDPIAATGACSAPSFQLQPWDQASGYPNDMGTFFPLSENSRAMTFGAPLFTNFAQGVPVFNMKDLWGNIGSSTAFDSVSVDMNTSQNRDKGQIVPTTPSHGGSRGIGGVGQATSNIRSP
jgi:hypothetical protein